MTLVSGAAFGLWVILAVSLFMMLTGQSNPFPVISDDSPGRLEGLAGLTAVAAFFFLPPGSLPPFINHAWGGFFFLACFAVSLVLSREQGVFSKIGIVSGICAVTFFYARHRGMPGGFANLGTFVAMPVWSIVSVYEGIAFFLLALAAVFVMRTFAAATPSGKASFAHTASFMAFCALFVTLFLPWTCAPHVAWPVWAAAGCDFLLFWVKTACCMFCIRRFSVVPALAGRAAFVCCALGAALLLQATA